MESWAFFTELCIITRLALLGCLLRRSNLLHGFYQFSATMFAIPLNVFTIGLCLLSGIVIFATYAGCDPFENRIIHRTDAIVPYFVRDQLHFLPG